MKFRNDWLLEAETGMEESLQQWRQRRLAELCAADGWLSLVGLYWLEAGQHRIGSAVDCEPRLPSGPAHWGTLEVGKTLRWQEEGKVSQTLHSDQGQAPSVVRHDELSFILIERDGQIALRLRDNAAPARQQFRGLDYFPEQAAWQVEASWQAVAQTLEVATMSGGLESRQISGRALFHHQGREYTLTPLEESPGGLFFVFADASSGKPGGSYGGGRFLWAPYPEQGRLVLDFNRAYNPPCAFTPFATCPLAPSCNRLPFVIDAGEQYQALP